MNVTVLTYSLAVVLIMLSGCGAKPPGRIVSLSFDPGQLGSFLQSDVIKVFDKARENVSVTITPNSADADVLVREGSFLTPTNFEKVLDLSPFIDEDLYDLRQHPDLCVKAAQSGNAIYGLPICGGGPVVMYVNTDLLRRHNITPPDDTWDWKRFKEIAGRFHPPDNSGGEIFGYIPQAKLDVAAAFAWRAGEELSLNGCREAMQLFLSLRPQRVPAEDPTQLFTGERLAMIADDSMLVPLIKSGDPPLGQWDVYPLPARRPGQATALNAFLCAVSKSSRYQAESWDFAKFLASSFVTYTLMKQGLFPARVEFLTSREFTDLKTSWREEIFAQELEHARLLPRLDPRRRSAVIRSLQQLLDGDMSAPEAAAGLASAFSSKASLLNH